MKTKDAVDVFRGRKFWKLFFLGRRQSLAWGRGLPQRNRGIGGNYKGNVCLEHIKAS